MGAYGHDITAGMPVFDRREFGIYRPGHEPVWLVESVVRREERHPSGDTTVLRTYAELRNAEVHGKNTTQANSGWSRTGRVDSLVEAAEEGDASKPGAFRMS